MAVIKKFEDIKSWQKARILTREIYTLSSQEVFAKDFDLKSQIRRSSISIMANIAEGFGRHSDKEFANFLNISHASAREVQSHLYIAMDLNYINQKKFRELYNLTEEICRLIYAFSQHLRKNRRY